MHPRTFKLTIIVTAGVALHSAFAQPLPGEFDASTVLRTPAPANVETLALDMSRIIGTQTMLIRLQATEYQRKVAEARARAFVAAQRKEAVEPRPAEKSAPNPKKPKASAPQVAVQPKKKLPRYLAVETVKDKRSAPEVKKVIMIWDTQSESLVSNDLYDVKTPPSPGSVAKFETYSAEYIGAGSDH
jgi:hypothetical protein